MRRGLTSLLLAVLAVSLLTFGAGVASAHEWKVDSKVTIEYNESKEQFQGHVKSERRACERNREVVVKRIKPNTDQVVGRDKTNDNGFYEVSDPNPHGDFYAKARRKEKSGGDHVCKAARSKPIAVD